MSQILINSKRKWFYFLIFFIIFVIILPYTIYGFRLKDSSSEDDDSEISDKSSSKKTEYHDVDGKMQSTVKPQYKFRKISKIVYEVDDDENENDEESEADAEMTEDIDASNDGGNFEFEKVHRSDFSKPSSESIIKAMKEETEKEEDEIIEESSQTVSSIFSYLNIFSSNEPKKPTKSKLSPPSELESNGLINWLRSFLKLKDEKLYSRESTKIEPSWIMSYFNRWPINIFIPFEKSDPKIWIPPPMPDTIEPENSKEPLSQEHFNFLLYHFPNFVLNPSNVREIDCKDQVQIFQRQLRGNKLWTLRMLDSSAKFPSGILRGNTNQFGDFDSCVNIKTLIKVKSDETLKIKGKYCLAHIDLKNLDDTLKLPVHLAQGKGMWKSHIKNPGHLIPRYTTLNWGICIPNQCSHKEVYKMLEQSLKPYNNTGIHFHIKVDEEDCFVKKNYGFLDLMRRNTKVLLTVGLYLIFVLIVISATIVDNWETVKEWAYQNVLKRPQEIEEQNSEDNEINKKENENEPTDEKINKEENNGNCEAEKSDFEKLSNEFISRYKTYKNNIQSIISSIEMKYFWVMLSYIKALYYQIPGHHRATISKVSYEILLIFSLTRTIPALVTTDPEVDIVSLHGLKVISTLMLYFFTKFMMLGHLSIINRDDMVKTFNNPLSILVRTPLVYMDTLLLIAGFLSSREMCKQLEQKEKISVLRIIAGKLIRSLPTLLAILFFQSWILPHLGSGPLWSNLIRTNADLCERNQWRNFFGIQNFINVEESCSPFTNQLALDLQLFFIGCLLVWFYYKNEDIGFGIYGAFHAISVAARYSHTHSDRLSSVLFHGMNVSKFYRTANTSFSSPLDRATAYLIGIGTGLLIWTSDVSAFEISSSVSILAWSSSILGIFWCFWYPWHATKFNFIYDPVDAATYASWAPLFLSLALAWIIFASSFTTTPLNPIFYSKPLVFFSKISYPMQLVIFIVVMYTTALNKEPIRFQIADLMDFGEIFVITITATVLAIVIDQPFQSVRKIFLETEFFMISSTEEDEYEEEIGGENDGDEIISDAENIGQHDSIREEEEEEEAAEDIWNAEQDDAQRKSSLPRIREESPTDQELEENWRTESDLEKYHLELTTDKAEHEDSEEPAEEEEEDDQEIKEEEEEEDEQEIKEEEEVVRRPLSFEPNAGSRRRGNLDY